jgi:hypothetical protein
VHRSTLAGTWYPGSGGALRTLVDDALEEARQAPPVTSALARGGRVRGLVLPHAGLRWSGTIAARGCALLEQEPVSRVILLGTAHRLRFRGLSLHAVDAIETPLGQLPVDSDAVDALLAEPDFDHIEAAHDGEHSIEIELPLLQALAASPTLRLVPALVSELDADALDRAATALGRLIDPETVVIASSDLTHFGDAFGYRPFAIDDVIGERLRELDMGAIDRLLALDRTGFEDYCARTGVTICGVQPLRLLVELMRRREPAVEGTLLGYTTSAALAGEDYAHSVSYASVVYRDAGTGHLDAAAARTLLRLARRTLELAAPAPHRFEPDQLSLPATPEFRERRAVFVTLHIDGELRGCIGTTVATRPLAAAVVSSAWAAAFDDPRFPPLAPDEVPRVEIEISVLTPLETVERPEEIVAGRDGVLIEHAGHRGVFLPQVAAEQGWDRRTLLERLAIKAGLEPSSWITGAAYRRFQVQTLEERAAEMTRGADEAHGADEVHGADEAHDADASRGPERTPGGGCGRSDPTT